MDSQSTNPNSPQESEVNTLIISDPQTKIQLYNNEDYELPPDSKSDIYIFKNNLFTRALLPIDITKQREILIKCTTCSYSKVEQVHRFQSSNFVKHYRYKHPLIAYNKESEKTLKLKTQLPSKTDFFTQPLDTRKRTRADTTLVEDFNEEDAYSKILTFIIENNLSFNILNSNSFRDLLNYYNRFTPIINRWNIKTILDTSY
jgi:hypothetical protein